MTAEEIVIKLREASKKERGPLKSLDSISSIPLKILHISNGDYQSKFTTYIGFSFIEQVFRSRQRSWRWWSWWFLTPVLLTGCLLQDNKNWESKARRWSRNSWDITIQLKWNVLSKFLKSLWDWIETWEIWSLYCCRVVARQPRHKFTITKTLLKHFFDSLDSWTHSYPLSCFSDS